MKKDNEDGVSEHILKGTDHNHIGDYMFSMYGETVLIQWIKAKNVYEIHDEIIDKILPYF